MRKKEDVVMRNFDPEILKKLNIIVGTSFFSNKVSKIFDDNIINFLDEISKETLKKKNNTKYYEDLITFAFWIRKKNILNIVKDYIFKDKMIGNGIVFHLTPSNIPMNFAYSLVFGLLSGNSNILRLPSRNFIQTSLLCNIIIKVLKKKKFKQLKSKICLIKYEKSDEVSEYFSKNADVRIIWGGDKTINQFKKYNTSPRCVDITFSDRYSLSLLGSEKILQLKNDEFTRLIDKFYNDTYIMDQKGCSSPQGIVWLGKKKKEAKLKFYRSLLYKIKNNYDHNLSTANEKISNLSLVAAKSKLTFNINYKNFSLLIIKPNKFNCEIEKIRPYNGSFVEMDLDKINNLKKIISRKCQTISYFGVDKDLIKNLVIDNGLLGVDRIVPVGRALEMNLVWDGKDLIYSLSRIIGS